MRRRQRIRRLGRLIVGLCVLAPTGLALAQEVNLDKLEKCGDLLCYQSLDEPTVFYYLPDQPRLAVKDGRPQFSFLKYARVQETEKAGIGRASGGAIVHFLVTYGADDARVKAAEAALQEKLEEARLAGPIIYRKGSFALVTSFKEGDQNLTRTVAVGKAPLMEGQKVAVSMGLTRDGAELLWESFQSATPDISLVFDMEFTGVREPYEARLEADWKQISKHHRLQAGMKYKWFGADVDVLFQDLRQTGAVKITTKGKDAVLDKILQSANAKLLAVMFDPAASQALTKAGADKGAYSNLNEAVKRLKQGASVNRRAGKRAFLVRPGGGRLADAFDRWLNQVPLRLMDAVLAPARAADDGLHARARAEFAKGVELINQDKYSEAIPWFEKANEHHKAARGRASVGALINLGQCHVELGAWEQARAYLTEGLALIPADPKHEKDQGEAHAYLGKSLHGLGREAEARQHLRKATEVPTDAKAFVLAYVARVFADMGDYAEAAHYYKQTLSVAKPGTDEERQAKRGSSEMATKAYNRARRLDEQARAAGYAVDKAQKALDAYLAYQDNVVPTGQRAKEVAARIRLLSDKLEQGGAGRVVAKGGESRDEPATRPAGSAKAPTASTPAPQPGSKGRIRSGSEAKPRPAPGAGRRTAGTSKQTPKPARQGRGPRQTPNKAKREKGLPGFSLVASYRMKRIKRSGKLVYEMNHFRNETQAFAMAENIGDLFRRWGRDRKVFRAVNLDDPVFKQRDILVTLDGEDARTFGEHVNFVTVQMEKRHQSGEKTRDELVITPEAFNAKGNNFHMRYGWKGDHDRDAWLRYQARSIWSFHGGTEVRLPWEPQDTAILSLAPPHRYQTITIEGEGKSLSDAGVRHGVVSITSQVGGSPLLTRATIRNRGNAPSAVVEVPTDPQASAPTVDITWYLQGGKTVSAPARTLEGDIVYWDELPEES